MAEVNIMMAHFMQIIDARLVDIIKKRHGHDFERINPLAIGKKIANHRAAKAMLGNCLGIFNAGHPPAAALDAF